MLMKSCSGGSPAAPAASLRCVNIGLKLRRIHSASCWWGHHVSKTAYRCQSRPADGPRSRQPLSCSTRGRSEIVVCRIIDAVKVTTFLFASPEIPQGYGIRAILKGKAGSPLNPSTGSRNGSRVRICCSSWRKCSRQFTGSPLFSSLVAQLCMIYASGIASRSRKSVNSAGLPMIVTS